MTDIARSWSDPFNWLSDWIFDPAIADLATGRDLESAVIISMFSDRLAHPDDRLPDPLDSDRRGWWADWDAEEGNIGSRLWLISREKQTEEVRLRVEDYCREALAWMLEDDVADRIVVTAEWNRQAPGRLDVDVLIARAHAVLLHRSFSWAWHQMFPRSI